MVVAVAVAAALGSAVGGVATYAAVRAGFSDVPPTHPFYDEIQWASDTGVVGGFPNGTFKPSRDVTRQAAVAFLANYNEGFRIVSSPQDWFNDDNVRELVVSCGPNERALAGGGFEATTGMVMESSYPSNNAGAVASTGSNSWTVRWAATNGFATGWIQTYALCAPMRIPVG